MQNQRGVYAPNPYLSKKSKVSKSDATGDEKGTNVQGLSGTLESVHDIEGGDSLPLGVLSVSNRITNDI